jgi:hypothetical protein
MSERYNPESSVREYCLNATYEFITNLDTEDRAAFFEDYKNTEGDWVNVGSIWADFLRSYILIPSGFEAISDGIVNDMMEYAESDDTVTDLLKELAGDTIDAESIACEEDEDAATDRASTVEMLYKTITHDDGHKTVVVETQNGLEEVSLSVFSKIAQCYKLTTPNTPGNNNKWVWRKTVAGKDYVESKKEPSHKISFA